MTHVPSYKFISSLSKNCKHYPFHYWTPCTLSYSAVWRVLIAPLNCWRNSTPLVIWHPAWVPWFSFISSQKDWYGRFVGKNIAKLIKKRLNQCFPFWSVSKESQEKLITLVTILCFSIHVKIHQACYLLLCYYKTRNQYEHGLKIFTTIYFSWSWQWKRDWYISWSRNNRNWEISGSRIHRNEDINLKEGLKKKLVEFSTKRGKKIKKRKMIYSPWNKFCMIWVLWHLSDGLSREL